MSRLPALILAAAAAGIAALSLVAGWLIHVRHVGGHGLTQIVAVWNAWEGRAWPFLPVAVAAAVLVGLLALADLLRPRRAPAALLLGGSTLALGIVLAVALPLEHRGYASRVVMTPGWPVAAGAILAGAMAVASVLRGGAAPRRWLVVAAVVAGVAVAAFGARIVALNLAEGDPRSYTTGTYVREAVDGQAAATLVIGDHSYRVDDRWAGTFEGRGLVVVLTDDPACPDDRGSYRIFPAGGDAIRWNTIVDLCADGARARDLTTGVWDPAD